MITLQDVTKIYHSKANDLTALQEVSLEFPTTGLVGILGPSGCGKTTLLNLLGGLDKQSAGSIYFEGKDTNAFRASEWDRYRRDHVGFVFQTYNLIPTLTIGENIGLALPDSPRYYKENKAKIREVLHRVGLENIEHKWPYQLSGGQQQRVAIARAIVKSPKVVLADEPTGALDSKTAHEVMALLKEISSSCLVIVVTHNDKLAHEFATQLIELQDGEVMKKTILQEESSNKEEVNLSSQKQSRSLGIVSSFVINGRQFIQKLIRSILIVLAGSIGVVGVCLVLTISSGVQKYIIDIQRETLSNSPITIRSTADNENPNPDTVEYEAYPTTPTVYVSRRNAQYYGHINLFSNQFLDYLNNMDSSLYNIIDYKTAIDMKILTFMHGSYKKVSNYKFMMLGEESEYVEEQYDVLYGSIPNEAGELAILVDQYNCIDVSVLNYLGIDFEGLDEYTFDEIASKEYKILFNDTYYYDKGDGTFGYYGSSQYATLYQNEQNITLNITGILRRNREAKTDIYESGMLYTKALRDALILNAHESQIGIAQLTHQLTKNVFTGLPFEDSVSYTGTISKEYLYEAQLGDLGLVDEVSTIRIYTDNFDSRVAINSYIANYNTTLAPDDKILYSDYMGSFSIEFDAFIEVLTTVLIIFASISLLVSSIMIGIITYISVMERMRDVGILRSLGGSRGFIRRLFNVQNGILGLSSGALGIIGASLFMEPIVGVMVEIMERNDITTFDISSLQFSSFGMWYFIVIIVLNMALSITSGMGPAIMGSFLNPIEAMNKE